MLGGSWRLIHGYNHLNWISMSQRSKRRETAAGQWVNRKGEVTEYVWPVNMIGDVQFPAGQGRWPQLAVCSQLTLHYTSPLTPHTEFLSPLKSFDDTKKKPTKKRKKKTSISPSSPLFTAICARSRRRSRKEKAFCAWHSWARKPRMKQQRWHSRR